MSRIQHLTARFVESFPTPLEPGILYVSGTYATAAHLCACGCGREVNTRLSPARWTLTFDGEATLRPSIGNWSLPCRSHYILERGQIRWARGYGQSEIDANREADRNLSERGRRPATASWPRRLWLRLTQSTR